MSIWTVPAGRCGLLRACYYYGAAHNVEGKPDKPDYERILTIEDTRELVVPQRNHIHMMYAKDGKSLQKAGAKELLKSALRMRPDRILLQELRDGTALFYLRNVNSG